MRQGCVVFHVVKSNENIKSCVEVGRGKSLMFVEPLLGWSWGKGCLFEDLLE